jgi:hypothetical protein
MPPKLHPRVKHAVPQAIFRAVQARLQAEVDSTFFGGGLEHSELRDLRPVRAEWTLIANRNKHSFVCAGILWSDGLRTSYRWRLPYAVAVKQGAAYNAIPIRQVKVASATLFRYPPGARAGSGASPGGSGRRPSASQPQIGRAYKRRARSDRSISSAP